MAEFNKKTRLEYIDVFRGIALLIMVFIQVFDRLSVSNIYTTPPYYVEFINSVTWVPPSLLFTFVSGMSVFLLSKKLIETKRMEKFSAFRRVFTRYGKYVLISLPFTWFMWEIGRYWGWQEAIQGIGLTGIFTAFFLIFVSGLKIDKKKIIMFSVLIITFAFLQSWLPTYLTSSGIGENYPYSPDVSMGAMSVIGSVLLNAFVRGWFSISNLFPMMLGGVIMLYLIQSKISNKKLLGITFVMLLIPFLLHFSGYAIDYYNRSFSFTFFAVGQSAFICALTYSLYTFKFKNKTKKFMSKVWEFLRVYGITAFFVYITHYLLIIKLLEITNLADLLPDVYAILLTIPFVFLIYFIAKRYEVKRNSLPYILRL